MFVPDKAPTSNETELRASDAVLVPNIPATIKDLPVAFVLHSDCDVNEKVDLSWEIVGAGGFVTDYRETKEIKLTAEEPYKGVVHLPTFQVPVGGTYTIVMYLNNERFADYPVEIREPRE